MSLSRERIFYLLNAYTSKSASREEEDELMEWVEEAEEVSELKEYVLGLWQKEVAAGEFGHVDWRGIYERIKPQEEVISIPPVRKIWWRVAAAAVILLLIGAGTWVWMSKKTGTESVVKTTNPATQKDIAAPSSNKAVLTLADGSKVQIDSAQIGSLAMQGKVNVVKLDNGQIKYTDGGIETRVAYNTLTVPKGSKPVHLVLADGTGVWLNVASSITYPTVFTGKDRKVEVTGEVYFEVSHDASKPFTVQKGDVRVAVLGTHFNVKAYYDEEQIRVTLLEGSVNVSRGNQSAIVRPGEQSVLTLNAPIAISYNADLEEVMAWKNGLFKFNRASLEEVMRQIARWYDVEIKYEGKIPPMEFGGKMSRNSNASEVLKILELSNVHYKIDGKNIVVMP